MAARLPLPDPAGSDPSSPGALPQPLQAGWRSSSFSTGADSTCVDVALGDRTVLLRDSKNPDGPVLRFTFAEWCAFLLGVRAGEFELPL